MEKIMLMLLNVVLASAMAQSIPEGLGKGWTGEFEHATRQILALAEEIPEEKYAFQPAPGTRTTASVLMHIAVGNYYLLAQAGVKPGGANWPEKIEPDAEQKVTRKAEVLKWLRSSSAAVREAHPSIDGAKTVKFFGAQVPASHVTLRILVHNHEHMGQLIAYARMSGVTPPWSRPAAARK
jgi:uncharacterized damage-inducible protein DinB